MLSLKILLKVAAKEMTQQWRELDASRGPQFVSSTDYRSTGSNTLFWITPVPTHSWHRLTQTHTHKQKQMKKHTKRKMLTFPKYHLSPGSGPLVFQLYFVPMCLVAVQMLHCWCTHNSLEQGRIKICPEMENPLTLEVPNSSAAPCVCVCIGLWWRFQSKKEVEANSSQSKSIPCLSWPLHIWNIQNPSFYLLLICEQSIISMVYKTLKSNIFSEGGFVIAILCEWMDKFWWTLI